MFDVSKEFTNSKKKVCSTCMHAAAEILSTFVLMQKWENLQMFQRYVVTCNGNYANFSVISAN
jgi:hypothetical protein